VEGKKHGGETTMKTRKILVGLIAALAMLAVSCGFQFEGDLSVGVEPLSRSELLALQRLRASHEITQGELEAKLLEFLGDSGSRSAFGASVITGVEMHEAVFEQGFARSAGGAPVAEIPFYVFSLENKAARTSGFALASGDSRVGDLFAVVEDGELDADHPFFQVFFANLDDYILESMEVYNNVTAEEIEAAISRQAAVASSASDPSRSTTIRELRIATRWDQDDPYNDVIRSLYGQSYMTGCVAVAVAQIMAYHKHPAKPAARIVDPVYGRAYTSFIDPYTGSTIRFADMKYDWAAMTSTAVPASADAKRAVGVLMAEVADRYNLNMAYGTKASSAFSKDVARTFRNMGYKNTSPQVPYNFNTIKASIDKGSPVYVSGYSLKTTTQVKTPWWNIFKKYQTVVSHTDGHAWVIDGYRTSPQMVHCNLGWGVTRNGWYYSGVFDTNRVPEPTRSVEGTSYNYQFEQKIVANIAK